MFFGGGGEGVPGGVGELLLVAGDLTAQVADALFLGVGGVFGVEVGAVEEFGEGAGLTAFHGEQGLGVVLVVDAGLHHFLIDIEGVGDQFPFGGFGGGPVVLSKMPDRDFVE